MDTVEYSISDSEIINLNRTVPISVQVRQLLNNNGFKFEDDGKISSIINEDPKPLGKFTCWYDIESCTTHYRQEQE